MSKTKAILLRSVWQLGNGKKAHYLRPDMVTTLCGLTNDPFRLFKLAYLRQPKCKNCKRLA